MKTPRLSILDVVHPRWPSSAVGTRRLKIAGLILALLVILLVIDLPQTVRMKAFLINALPLDAETKIDAVHNLCMAAFATSPSGVVNCDLANRSVAALAEVNRRQKEAADEEIRREKCKIFTKRITEGDWRAEWKSSSDKSFYFYDGADAAYKGLGFWPKTCTFVTGDGFKTF